VNGGLNFKPCHWMSVLPKYKGTTSDPSVHDYGFCRPGQ
jgi:hypothetical protein